MCGFDAFLFGGHLIADNDIHDTVRETGDHGPFNSWGRDAYWCPRQSHGHWQERHPAGPVRDAARLTTTVRHNRFHDRSGWGIDLDDGSSNYVVEDNLCLGIGIKLREGDYRTVQNNILYHPANPLNSHVALDANHDIVRHNIVVVSAAAERPEADVNFASDDAAGTVFRSLLAPLHSPLASELDHNLYWSDRGQCLISHGYREQEPRDCSTLAEWQALGYDQHSVYADPQFTDPAAGDLTLQPGSPALALGFQPFTLTGFGCAADVLDRWDDSQHSQHKTPQGF